jgi:hypothetical protein
VELVCIEAEAEIQGVLVTSLPRSRPRLSHQRGWLLYVEYIAAAPWNRRIAGSGNRRYKRVGPLLLQHAVRRSMSERRRGRIGLHSEPGETEDFYRSIGLKERGPDEEDEGRLYFEGPEDWAEGFLQEP